MRFVPPFAAIVFLSFGLPGPSTAADDVARGQTVFGQCRACHTVDKAGGNRVGPSLYGVVGRTVGTAAGYPYSKPYLDLKDKGTVWDENRLTKYLADPRLFLQAETGDAAARTKMVFRLPKEADRRDVIAYLKSLP